MKSAFFSFGKRYLIFAVIAYLLATYIALKTGAEFLNLHIFKKFTAIYSLALVSIFIATMIFRKHNRELSSVLLGATLIVLVFISGFYRTAVYMHKTDTLITEFKDYSSCEGIILSQPKPSSTGKSSGFDLMLYKADGKDLQTPAKIRIYADAELPDFEYKDRISAEIKFLNGNATHFDYSRFLLQSKVLLTAYTDKASRIEAYIPTRNLYNSLTDLGMSLRRYITDVCNRLPLGDSERALLTGLSIGDKGGFSDDMLNIYSSSGFMHIVAVSGMHTSYLLMFLSFILGFIRFPRRATCVIAIPVLILFGAVSLFTPSVCRAVIMMSVMLIASAINRQYDPITALGLSAVLLAFECPYCLESVSFLMSYGATLGILVFYKPLYARLSPVLPQREFYGARLNFISFKRRAKYLLANYCLSSVCLSLCATLGLVYFTAKYFGVLQTGGIIGNIIVMPAVAVAFIGGVVIYLLFPFAPDAAAFICKTFVSPCLTLINTSAEFFASEVFHRGMFSPPDSFFWIYIMLCVAIYIWIKE